VWCRARRPPSASLTLLWGVAGGRNWSGLSISACAMMKPSTQHFLCVDQTADPPVASRTGQRRSSLEPITIGAAQRPGTAGQARDDIDVLGLRYAGTVEDDVYHALSERFGDIFSVLGAAAGCPPASVRPLEHLPPERLIPTPDCAIKYIARSGLCQIEGIGRERRDHPPRADGGLERRSLARSRVFDL